MRRRIEKFTDRMMERIIRSPFVGAWRAVAVVTLAVTVASGLLMRLIEPERFPTAWTGLWWAVQTVTTVGYGDVVPTSTGGRLLATVVMLGGIGFITVSTGAITSAFIESRRRRRDDQDAARQTAEASDLARLSTQVEALTAEVRELRRGRDAGPPAPPPA